MDSFEAALLTELHDIAVPELTPPPIWPWLLLAITTCTALYALLIGLRVRLYPWYLPALSQLQDFRQLSPQARSLPLHKLLRQIAMAERPDSAGLQGEQWNRQLDTILRTQLFFRGQRTHAAPQCV